MKIAIPTRDGRRISSNIQNIIGFNVYEIADGRIVAESFISRKQVEKRLQEEFETDEGYDKEKELSLISGIWDCQIVISNGFGKQMFEELVKAQKEVYITEAVDSRIAINHFIRQTLKNHPELA
jgi:predicted Fe-Mo cluster-binding NifX family protein